MVNIAVVGCCHGELDAIYSRIRSLSASKAQKVDILLICGDFQAVRDEADMKSLAVPEKYRKFRDFQQYFDGVKKAPILTLFVGGNHESSRFMNEIKFGGWVAPNIYYMGKSNVLWFKGLKIGGISGIFNESNFMKNNFEEHPFNASSIRSVYHVRKLEYLKMYTYSRLSQEPMDIFLSHDWPTRVVEYGDKKALLAKKPYFARDIENCTLGSPVNEILLKTFKPKMWFSAHLHVRFEASVTHKEQNSKVVNNNEISLALMDSDDEEDDDDDKQVAVEKNLSEHTESKTKFLALDKVLPRRQFLEIIPIDGEESSAISQSLQYDTLFLKVTKFFEKFEKTQEFSKLSKRMMLEAKKPLENFVETYKETILNEKVPESTFDVPSNFDTTQTEQSGQTEQFRTWLGL